MNQIAIFPFQIIFLFLIVCAGCSREPISNAVNQESETDGGGAKNANREKAEEYFIALTKVKSAKEEKKVLTAFAGWLNEKGYRIRVEEKQGKHFLSCPYFPPVTPWTLHSFFDIKNLELLPRLPTLDDGG